MKLGNSSAAMGVGVYFFILRLRVSGLGWQVGAWVVLSVAWSASCSLLVRRSQVVIFNVCNERRICSVWQVAWERMNGCSYVIERTTQSSSLLREGGLRNNAARAALWRTRPYECAIDVCQLLTIVIADVCRAEFSSLMFATNSGFVRFDNVVNRMETF